MSTTPLMALCRAAWLLALAVGTPAFAQVQVLALADRTVAAATGTLTRSGQNFCVVSTTPAALTLTFTNASGAAGDGQSWLAKNSSGASIAYLQYVSYADATGEVLVSRSVGGGNVFTVAAGKAAASSLLCGAGNLTKSVIPTSGRSPIGGPAYSDTVTITAAPL